MLTSDRSTRGRCSAGAGGRSRALRLGPRAVRGWARGRGGADCVAGGAERGGGEDDAGRKQGDFAAQRRGESVLLGTHPWGGAPPPWGPRARPGFRGGPRFSVP